MRLLGTEFLDRQPVLEVGIGTGRIGLPLAASGVRLLGVDLSPSMLARLRRNAADLGVAPPPVAIADATRLPFDADAFGGAFVVHVLHLISDWRTAVAEMVRVVRAGGVVLFDLGGGSTAPGREIRARFEQELGAEAIANLGVQWGRARLDGLMADLGARRRPFPQVSLVERTPLADHFRMIADGRLSWTWRIPEADRRAAVDVVRAWAEDRFGDLEIARPVRRRTRIRAYDVVAKT